MVKLRPYVVGVDHVAGCRKKRCGSACRRRTDGLEADIRIRWPDGREERVREKVPVTGTANAKRWAQDRESEIYRSGGKVALIQEVKKEVPTFEAFVPKFMTFSKTNNKPSTVYAKEWMLRIHLVPFFGRMPLDRIGPADIEAYKATKIDEKQDKKSINNHLAALRKLLNLAHEYEVIAKVPKVKAFRFKNNFITEDQFLSFEETDRFLQAAAPEWKPFVMVALKTGLRPGELLALKWEDIDLIAGQLIVRRTLWRGQEGPPKGGCNRKVPLSDGAIATLKAHRHLKGPYVFCETGGRPLTHSRIKDVTPAVCRKGGLAKRLTNHGLRHTFASHLVMRGVSLMAVKELLGHESIEMTLRYAHLSPDVKRDAVKMLDAPVPASRATEAHE